MWQSLQMRTYSIDLRERIVAARARGYSAAEVARVFQISKRSVERYCKLQATTGSLQPKPRLDSFAPAHCTHFLRHAQYATD